MLVIDTSRGKTLPHFNFNEHSLLMYSMIIVANLNFVFKNGIEEEMLPEK